MSEETLSLFKNTYKRCRDLILNNNVIIYRYEDVIYRKYEWICDIAKSIGADLDHSSIQEILLKNDIRPLVEDPNKHIRQVSPGNFRHRLNEKTIELLNHEFSDVLRWFNYDTITKMQLSPDTKAIVFAPPVI